MARCRCLQSFYRICTQTLASGPLGTGRCSISLGATFASLTVWCEPNRAPRFAPITGVSQGGRACCPKHGPRLSPPSTRCSADLSIRRWCCSLQRGKRSTFHIALSSLCTAMISVTRWLTHSAMVSLCLMQKPCGILSSSTYIVGFQSL